MLPLFWGTLGFFALCGILINLHIWGAFDIFNIYAGQEIVLKILYSALTFLFLFSTKRFLLIHKRILKNQPRARWLIWSQIIQILASMGFIYITLIALFYSFGEFIPLANIKVSAGLIPNIMAGISIFLTFAVMIFILTKILFYGFHYYTHIEEPDASPLLLYNWQDFLFYNGVLGLILFVLINTAISGGGLYFLLKDIFHLSLDYAWYINVPIFLAIGIVSLIFGIFLASFQLLLPLTKRYISFGRLAADVQFLKRELREIFSNTSFLQKIVFCLLFFISLCIGLAIFVALLFIFFVFPFIVAIALFGTLLGVFGGLFFFLYAFYFGSLLMQRFFLTIPDQDGPFSIFKYFTYLKEKIARLENTLPAETFSDFSRFVDDFEQEFLAEEQFYKMAQILKNMRRDLLILSESHPRDTQKDFHKLLITTQKDLQFIIEILYFKTPPRDLESLRFEYS